MNVPQRILLKRPYVIFHDLIEAMLHLIQNLHLCNISIHRNLYQNQLINKCVSKNLSISFIASSKSKIIRLCIL